MIATYNVYEQRLPVEKDGAAKDYVDKRSGRSHTEQMYKANLFYVGIVVVSGKECPFNAAHDIYQIRFPLLERIK